MVAQGLHEEELLRLLVGDKLMSYQESCFEVVVAVVAGCSEDVGHPAGRSLWQDSGDEGEVVPLERSAAQEELGLSDPKQGGGACCPKVRQLEEARRLPGGLVAGNGGVVLLYIHVSVVGRKCTVEKMQGHQMLRRDGW